MRKWVHFISLFGILVIFSASVPCVGSGEAPLTAQGKQGMVSSGNPLATQAGVEILKRGGNAFDAAVAVAAALNVTEPMMSGMGGYGTILIYHAESRRIRFLDSSGKIPAAVNSDAFRAPTPGYLENRRGPKAVSTPGNVNAWEAMSKNYGILEWKELFFDAIRLAEGGFVLDDRTARTIEYAFDDFPDYAKLFYGKNGKSLQSGDRLIQKDLAGSLKRIAREGAGVFYSGSIGREIDSVMKRSGGFLSLKDLNSDRAEWWEPLSIDYRGFRVYTASPPSTAFPSLIRLGMMSRFKAGSLSHNSAEYLHRFAEVSKHAYWCRLAYAGDPEINPPPLDKLLSPEYWNERISKLDLEKASDFIPPGLEINQGKNTTHFVVADRWGNIVSATQTLGNAFGSRIMVPETGIWLNNSLAYCTFEPKGNPMDAHAGHRKLSGDCPTIIFCDGRPWAALGTPGGHTIGQTVPQMVLNMLEFGMDIGEALAAPRISFIEPDTLAVEDAVPEAVRSRLSAMGHLIRVVSGLGLAHGLTLEYDAEGKPKNFRGAADPRGRGLALGF